MSNLAFFLVVLIAIIAFAVIVEVMIRKGKLKRPETYSYKAVLQEGLRWLIWTFAICIAVYFFSGSLEASLTLAIFIFFCIISGCLKGLFIQYKIKKSGGTKRLRNG